MPYWIIPLGMLIVFEIIADIFSKEWSLKDQPKFWLAAIACYVIANIFWLSALKSGAGLGRGAVIFSVATAVIALIIGLLVYGESVSRIQLVGLIFGVVSLVLIFW